MCLKWTENRGNLENGKCRLLSGNGKCRLLIVSCLQAMSILYKHYAKYQKLIRAEDDPQKGKKKKKFTSRNLLLQVHYYEELTRRQSIGGKMGLNSAICLDLARLIQRDANSGPKKEGDLQLMLEEAYHNMYSEGPGCFSWADEKKTSPGGWCCAPTVTPPQLAQKSCARRVCVADGVDIVGGPKYIKYVPCFHPCPCGSEAMKPPFKPYREMCEKKSHEYEPCTARRDTRTLLRRHDQKVKLLPQAEVGGVYIPLMMTMVAGVACE
ncbi:hypothetical protein ANCDUO_13972 [Ancylostoma duodenale]|uniref:Uncharacterized protein n=1 Tax=Ancylostoma duodenale TaxID=51022 RepID=A0A0C2GFI2_9BILA|nr:hypothetical protein ANCDUO_13972 [Ancylostoma duodenale]